MSIVRTSDVMVRARKYVVKKHFVGLPNLVDYEIVEHELPEIQDGEILLKTEWLSVDPYIQVFNSSFAAPYDQFGFQLGLVLESKDPQFPEGTRVVSHAGWCDYCILNVSKFTHPFEIAYRLPDMQGLPHSLAIGAAGMVGATAYFGLLNICDPKPGETLVVTVAAGAVGSLVGQIGKIKGCRVIGIAGSDEKVKWLENELGFDKAFNYKTADIKKALREAAPDGVDCYFDNVGGEISSTIVSQMNRFGRVSVCGCISTYNADPNNFPKASTMQRDMFFKELKFEGFIVLRWIDEWSKSTTDIIEWIKSGEIKVKEHVIEGFDNTFDAFMRMMSGENIGKTIVKL